MRALPGALALFSFGREGGVIRAALGQRLRDHRWLSGWLVVFANRWSFLDRF